MNTNDAGASPVEPTVMQHTPGPWHWEADEVKGDPTGRVRYQVTALGKTVTRVYYSSFEGGPTNAEADAKLIAAAPELLEALRKFRDQFDAFDPSSKASRHAMRMTLIDCDAAIAKATGAA